MQKKKTTKKCKDGCKADMFQDGGASSVLDQIMSTVNQGNPFQAQNETASLAGYNTWLKEMGYTSWFDRTSKRKEYTDYIASNKATNEQLPLAQNLAGLFELNNLERDELANRKDTLADYGTSISTFAPQGFAEDGGGINTENKPNLPSLQAILQGLPKEMKAKDKEKITVNANKELQQILGYKDNSPFKNLPSQTFDTDTLTMDGVSQPLLAIADNGQKQLMLPNSGEYYFPGASKVTEVPMAEEGGTPEGKDGDIKKSWREGKKLAVYMGGTWHHFGDSSMQDFRQHKSEEKKDAWYARHASALKGDDPRSKAFRKYAERTWESGGQPRQMIFNLFKQKPMSKYVDGGYSQSSPAYQYNLPVGNQAKVSGYLNLANLIPIQTEVKELIVLPTLDVVPVNAKKRHSKMDDDQVTDVVPENSYILSQFGQVDIYKSEADQIILETEDKPYNIYGTNPEPKVKTLGDIMNKKVMKPADLGRTLINKYKQMQNPGDPYTEQTNIANKQTLALYLQALIGLSEMDKARKGIDNSMEAQMSQGQLPQMVAANGGRVMKAGYSVPKAQEPFSAIANAGASILSGVTSLIGDYYNRKAVNQNTASSKAALGTYDKEVAGLSQNNLMTRLGLTALKTPEIKPIIENTSYLESLNRQLPQQFLDYQQSRNLANRPDFNMYAPQEANALSSQYYAQTLNSQASLALQAARERAAMFNNYIMQKGAADNRNIASRTNAFNAGETNKNALLDEQSNNLSSYFADRANQKTNSLQALMSINGQATGSLIQLNNNLSQSVSNSLAAGLQAYNSSQANNQQQTQQNQQNLCQPPLTGCPQGSFWSYAQCRCI